MARKKVLKSLAHLSAELIGEEAAKREETKLRPKADMRQPPQVARTVGSSEASTERGYLHWGLNE